MMSEVIGPRPSLTPRRRYRGCLRWYEHPPRQRTRVDDPRAELGTTPLAFLRLRLPQADRMVDCGRRHGPVVGQPRTRRRPPTIVLLPVCSTALQPSSLSTGRRRRNSGSSSSFTRRCGGSSSRTHRRGEGQCFVAEGVIQQLREFGECRHRAPCRYPKSL
jgi:hypothetical protein